MAGDLVGEDAQVHDAARRVLDFWFGLPPERWFEKDADLDHAIRERFSALRDRVKATGAEGWTDHPDTLLAAIILLDQFSRNLYRGAAEAFAADDLAARLTLLGRERVYDARLTPEQQVFLYMPLMHAEDGPLQDLSVAVFEALGREDNAAFARDHRDVFRRFGRFPGRNAALGRETTVEEAAWLAANDGDGDRRRDVDGSRIRAALTPIQAHRSPAKAGVQARREAPIGAAAPVSIEAGPPAFAGEQSLSRLCLPIDGGVRSVPYSSGCPLPGNPL